MKVRKKAYTDQSVYDATLDRIRYLYQNFDDINVSFSGGKDSTAALFMVKQVARELKRLPVTVSFVDEEAIPPETIEYVTRVSQDPELKFNWYCLPIRHRNACSNEQPWWHPWHPEEKHLWVRELPPTAITEHPKFNFGMTMPDFMDNLVRSTNNVKVTGVRTQESLRRLRAVSFKKNENYISYQGSCMAHPIYDWSAEDVWILVYKHKLDYNRTYDIMNKTGLYGNFLGQRVCPPYGEEPLRKLWIYAECWPEMWHKMLKRVKGVGTAWRYANTELYSVGVKDDHLPEGLTWRQYLDVILASYKPEQAASIRGFVNTFVKVHYNKSDDPIHDSEPNPLTGASWKFFCKCALKGDLKGRTMQNMQNQGEKVGKNAKKTYNEVRKLYGSSRIQVINPNTKPVQKNGEEEITTPAPDRTPD